MDRAEIALQLTLAAMDKLPIARGVASPKSTADAVGELHGEVLYKVTHAIEDADWVRQRVVA